MNRGETLKQAIAEALKQERKRVARELHDGVCQELAGLALMLDAIRARAPGDVAAEMSTIAKHLRRISLDARRLGSGLAPAAVERVGLADALAQLRVDSETSNGPVITVSIDHRCGDVRPEVAVNLYRIAQEAMTNALRHSHAAHINIVADIRGERLLLAVEDDGCGIRDAQRPFWGTGMESMASRAELLGAELSVLPTATGGTRVQVIVHSAQERSERA